ncbi:MAG: nitrite reductase small subunit NirD [Cyanobacteria bacterium P01_H01_bin.15]
MVQSLSSSTESVEIINWVTVCPLSAIVPNTGVNALLGTEQVAIFRIGETDEVYATGNYDPFSKAFVMSRGILGDRKGVLKVASPIYKQNFNLKTGECLDDAEIRLPVYPVRVVGGQVQLGTTFQVVE